MSTTLGDLLRERFGSTFQVPAELEEEPTLCRIAGHRSHRRFGERAVAPELLQALLGCAFSAPAKSDLQQSCVVHVETPGLRAEIDGLLARSPWVAEAPVMLIWCGDNRRIRRICDLRAKPFANDHFDSFFNAAVDCALVMQAFIVAAQAAGLGCCPLSAVRNHAERLSELLALPDHVFPVAGMVAGWPAGEVTMSPRLPLELFVHRDRYDDAELEAALARYDRRRDALRPIAEHKQRLVERYGTQPDYGWSEDKARQVSVSERGDFGAFVRARGFRLD